MSSHEASPDTERRFSLLIVDDEEGPRESLRVIFLKTYDIYIATSGEEAIALMKENPVDMAILDIRMDGISGIDVLHAMKKLDSSVEVIMLTAYETLETARQALRYGARDYVSKPFDVSFLRQAVSRAAEHRRISLDLASTGSQLDTLTKEMEHILAREEMAKTTSDVYAGVFHDINTPLTVIRGYVELLQAQIRNVAVLSGTELEDINTKLDVVSRQTKMCFAISRRYVSFLHRRNIENSTSSINTALRDLNEVTRVHPTLKSGKIAISYLSRDAFVQVHSTDLMQIIINLILNSVQSSLRSHQKVSVIPRHPSPIPKSCGNCEEKGEKLIHPENLHKNRVFAAISISDEGEGIPAELINDIFEPYVTTKSVQGSGLGLAIISRLLKNCNGALHLHSRLGEGATFTIYLPEVTSEE